MWIFSERHLNSDVDPAIEMSQSAGIISQDDIIASNDQSWILDPKGMGHLFYRSLQKYKDNILQIDSVTGKNQTFGEVLQLAIRVALKMTSYGVTANDTVTICSKNHLEAILPYIATFFAGAISSNFDTDLEVNDFVNLAKVTKPKIVFVQEEFVSKIEELREKTNENIIIVVFGASSKHKQFSEFVECSPYENDFYPKECDGAKTSLVISTSGSTGLPKAFHVSHRAYQGRIVSYKSIGGVFDRVLMHARLYNPTATLFWAITISGGWTQILLPQYDTALTITAISKYRPTFAALTYFLVQQLFNDKSIYDVDTTCFKYLAIGGGHIFDYQLKEYKQKIPVIFTGYGLSETGVVTSLSVDTGIEKQLSGKDMCMGLVAKGVCCKVVDVDTGAVLDPNKCGELHVKSIGLFTDYIIPVKNTWDSEGWFKTGDLVYYDDDFYFYFVDRKNVLLRFRDHYVSAKIVEKLILSHPKVTNACVIGIPHEEDHNHLMAILENENLSEAASLEKEIVDYVAENLEDKYHLRGGVKTVAKFPTTTSEKIDVYKLKCIFAKNN